MTYRFGDFELDAATGDLRRGGASVRLQAQPAQVLALLVERAGEIVTREGLRDAVWGGTPTSTSTRVSTSPWRWSPS